MTRPVPFHAVHPAAAYTAGAVETVCIGQAVSRALSQRPACAARSPGFALRRIAA